jgi:hypothetical protein
MLRSPIGTAKQSTLSAKTNQTIMSEVNMKKRNALQSVEKPSINLGLIEMKACSIPMAISEEDDAGNLVAVRYLQDRSRCANAPICDPKERML